MQIDPWMFFAVGGVVSLLIERVFYYKSKYSKKDNPYRYGERIATLEAEVNNIKDDISEIKRRINRTGK